MSQTSGKPVLRSVIELQLNEVMGTFQSMCERALPSAVFDACNKQLKAVMDFHDLNAQFFSSIMERQRSFNQTWLANLAETCQASLEAAAGKGQLSNPMTATIAHVNRGLDTLRQASAVAGELSEATVAHHLKVLDQIKSRVADGGSELLSVFDREKAA